LKNINIYVKIPKWTSYLCHSDIIKYSVLSSCVCVHDYIFILNTPSNQPSELVFSKCDGGIVSTLVIHLLKMAHFALIPVSWSQIRPSLDSIWLTTVAG